MSAHKFLEDLDVDYRKAQKEEDRLAIDCTKNDLRRAVKFQVEAEGLPMFGEKFNDIITAIKMPFPCSYIENEFGGVLCVEEEDFYWVDLWIKIPKNPGLPQGGSVCIPSPLWLKSYVEKEKGMRALVTMSQDPQWVAAWDQLMANKNQSDLIRDLVSMAFKTAAVIACSNVVTVDNPAPEALNKKRERQGKPPIYSYKTLHLKVPLTHQQSVTSQNIDPVFRHGPRLHLRRGHIRRLDMERTVWVTSCMVGTAERGIVEKGYRVSL